MIYGTANSTDLQSVQTIQNQLLKVLTEKPYRHSANQLHSELKLIKVEVKLKLKSIKKGKRHVKQIYVYNRKGNKLNVWLDIFKFLLIVIPM